jgi:hypothetical protein
MRLVVTFCEGPEVSIQGTRRSVEKIMVDTLEVVTSDAADDNDDEVDALPLLDDAALWRAARSHMPVKAVKRLSSLASKKQREGLTEDEAAEAEELVQQYEHSLLLRAEAAALLHERGHGVSVERFRVAAGLI